MENCVVFIVGAVIGIACLDGSDILQRVTYNGHKRKHVFKYQTITTPDGICIHVLGLEVRRKHDMFLYVLSRMDEMFQSILKINGKHYVVFGDSGYTWRVYLEVSFDCANLEKVRIAFKTAISKDCVSVE